MSVPVWVLVDVAVALGALLIAGWLVILGHAARGVLQRARRRRVRMGGRILMEGVIDGELSAAAWSDLETLRPSERVEAFLSIAPSLRGREREWLGEVADRLGIVAEGERLCRSRQWGRRLRGVRLLTLAGAGRDTVLSMVSDRHPLVRGQVAEWCGAHPSPEALSTLVAMLGDPDHASRFGVQDAMVRVGALSVQPLAGHLEAVTDPVEARAGLAVARALGDPALGPAVRSLCDHPDPEIRARALRALGTTGGAQAPARLERGLDDPDADVRAAAAHALGGMGHWPAGKALAARLRDPSWDVRAAAGAALLRIGAPGELLLRRALRSDDRFAADMARHALDTASVLAGPGTGPGGAPGAVP